MIKRRLCKISTCRNPVKEGDNYCLFHKPEKNIEEAKEFYKKIKKQATQEKIEDEIGQPQSRFVFKNSLNWIGCRFPPLPRSLAIESFLFYCALFENTVILQDAKFEGYANFMGAEFEGYVNFKRAEFKDYADFKKAKFGKYADFEGVDFLNHADCRGVRFQKGARHRDTEFEGPADFRGARFGGDADFKKAKFKGHALFEGTIFNGRCYFTKALFTKRLSFSNTKFQLGVVIMKNIGGYKEESTIIKDIKDRFQLPQAQEEACRVQKRSYEQEGKKEAADKMFTYEIPKGAERGKISTTYREVLC